MFAMYFYTERWTLSEWKFRVILRSKENGFSMFFYDRRGRAFNYLSHSRKNDKKIQKWWEENKKIPRSKTLKFYDGTLCKIYFKAFLKEKVAFKKNECVFLTPRRLS